MEGQSAPPQKVAPWTGERCASVYVYTGHRDDDSVICSCHGEFEMP